jgi:soluble lytic murein transglycosylase-like protein
MFGGRADLALAAYNAGPARARRPAAAWPAETRAYVPAVLALAGVGGGRARLVR